MSGYPDQVYPPPAAIYPPQQPPYPPQPQPPYQGGGGYPEYNNGGHENGQYNNGYNTGYDNGYNNYNNGYNGYDNGYNNNNNGYNNNNNSYNNNNNNQNYHDHQLERQNSYSEHQSLDFDAYNQERINKRKSVKHVELTQGNLVLSCPVPDKVLQNVTVKTGEEFTHMRYTAVTCDPDDFVSNNYYLRPYTYERETELMIVMTMYNEDDQLFIKTMSSAIKNIANLCSRDKSKAWGKDGWQKVVVVIVADGRNKVNQRVLKVLGAMGVYQEGIVQDTVADKPVTGHLFEYTSQLMVDSEFNIRGSDKNVPPVQILFCLKEKNAKKLNSHRWFFNAFAAQLNPNVCVLLDVGTKPSNTSIYHLWKAFDRDPNIGGACGEIKAEIGPYGKNLLNPLVASQNFEYKMSNILDKPLESVFGYISVLPGAFSAYRYKALQNTSHGVGPLASYFKGEAMHGDGAAEAGIFESNMYLAEDRILCFELVAKTNEAWTLKYVKSAKAETDVPDNVSEFISQRRRWLNGSFFAAFYSIANFMRIWSSGQPLFRKILLQIEFTYNAINLLFNWFALGNFYLAFFFLTSATTLNKNFDPFKGHGDELFDLVRSLYIMVIITIFISSMGNRPQGSKKIYLLCIILFAVIMATMLYCAGYTVYLSMKGVVNFKNFASIRNALKIAEFRGIVISLASTYGLYLFSSLLHGEPWHMITCLGQYTLLIPFYVNILMVYAFCNTHDVSWGTKGDNGKSGGNGAQPVEGKDGKKLMQVEVPHEKADINAVYDDLVKDLRIKVQEEKQHRDAATKKDDYYKLFRTNLVLAWMFSNAFLVVFFTSNTWTNFVIRNKINEGSYNPYLTFIFWSVAYLSAFRAFGCVWYLILRLVWG